MSKNTYQSKYKFFTLSECTDLEINQLVSLDEKAVRLYGNMFSEEKWSKENFLYELPQKNLFSLIAIKENKVVGFCISSLKVNVKYIHRFVTDSQENKENRLSFELMAKVIQSWNGDIALVVNSCNQNAIKFYTKNGFAITYDKELIEKIKISSEILAFTTPLIELKYLMTYDKKNIM
jgi:ribosomal protein S18 acetylase RimI-like enzyme